MNTKSQYTSVLRSAVEQPTCGVVGLVDNLLRACSAHGLQLDWQGSRCRVRAIEGDWEELEVPIRKSIFRAMLARMAALCNERSPNSVSPYEGQGELVLGADPALRFSVGFVNKADQQKLELIPYELLSLNSEKSRSG